MAYASIAELHSDRMGSHRLSFLLRKFPFLSMTLLALQYKSYCFSFSHISFCNLSILKAIAKSKGRIYSHLEISFAFSLGFVPSDFFGPEHTFQESD
jgi:hypothetical protein